MHLYVVLPRNCYIFRLWSKYVAVEKIVSNIRLSSLTRNLVLSTPLILTVDGTTSVGEYGAGLWRIPDRSRGGHMNVQPLQNVASLDGHKHTIKWYVD